MNQRFGCRGESERIGVIVAQLGTPDAPTPRALRTYLRQFLSDPRVIEVPRVLWWFILNCIILVFRPRRSAALYKRVWTPEGSPLLRITERQVNGLSGKLATPDALVEVMVGMRIGNPSIESAIDALCAKGCDKILLFPMFPQYSGATTASVYDAVFPHLLKRRRVPTLRVVDPYYRHPAYLNALAATINRSLASMAEPPERLLLSFHGVPQSYVKKGDSYCCHCTETATALIPLLNMPKDKILQTFQSRFGKDPWLTPYTDETVKGLAEQGIKRIAVACPGFPADCLETLDELGTEAAHLFKEHGGEDLHLIPCLNDSPEWIDAMAVIARETMHTWINPNTGPACCGVKCPVFCKS